MSEFACRLIITLLGSTGDWEWDGCVQNTAVLRRINIIYIDLLAIKPYLLHVI